MFETKTRNLDRSSVYIDLNIGELVPTLSHFIGHVKFLLVSKKL
jgi:hypothetical protein